MGYVHACMGWSHTHAHACPATCRLQAKWHAWCAYDAAAPGEGLSAALKVLKEKYERMSQPARFVRDVIARATAVAPEECGANMFSDKPRSGRPPLGSKIPLKKRYDCIKALVQGYMHQGKPRAYNTGGGLYECAKAAELMRDYNMKPKQLLKALMDLDGGLVVRIQVVKRALTLQNRVARLRCARERLRQLSRNPLWHNRCFMLDASHKFKSGLLQVKSKVITHKEQDLSKARATDDRITWGGSKQKVHWLTCVNPLGGASPLILLPGTTLEKGKAIKVCDYI